MRQVLECTVEGLPLGADVATSYRSAQQRHQMFFAVVLSGSGGLWIGYGPCALNGSWDRRVEWVDSEAPPVRVPALLAHFCVREVVQDPHQGG